MKRYTNHQYLIPCILFILFLLPTLVHAQPGFVDDTTDVPVDGGLSLLVAAGVGYGVKKVKGRKNGTIKKICS